MKPEFLTIVHQSQGIIHKVCRLYRDSQEDREDLFQEIVYQLWKSFPAFKGESKPSTWVYKIALSTAIAKYRSAKERVREEQVSIEGLAIASSSPDEELQDRLQWLYTVIATLSPVEKAIISLYLDEYSYKDIAAIIGLTENHVGVKMNRIKSKLKELSKEEYHGNK